MGLIRLLCLIVFCASDTKQTSAYRYLPHRRMASVLLNGLSPDRLKNRMQSHQFDTASTIHSATNYLQWRRLPPKYNMPLSLTPNARREWRIRERISLTTSKVPSYLLHKTAHFPAYELNALFSRSRFCNIILSTLPRCFEANSRLKYYTDARNIFLKIHSTKIKFR